MADGDTPLGLRYIGRFQSLPPPALLQTAVPAPRELWWVHTGNPKGRNVLLQLTEAAPPAYPAAAQNSHKVTEIFKIKRGGERT